MVGVFKRSLSFPNKIPNRQSKPSISRHVRSISLPCRSHPLNSHLKDDLTHLTSWSFATSDNNSRTSAWLSDGLTRLRSILDYLDDILQLPQTQESLLRQFQWVEKLLECFLRFVDVYGILQTLILAFKQEQSAAQIALRKKDDERLALYVKSRKRIAKKISKLVSTVRCIRVSESDASNSNTTY